MSRLRSSRQSNTAGAVQKDKDAVLLDIKSIKRTAEDHAKNVQRRLRSDAKAQYTLYRCQILIDKDEIPPDRRRMQILPENLKESRSSHTENRCDHGLHHLQDGSAGPKFR